MGTNGHLVHRAGRHRDESWQQNFKHGEEMQQHRDVAAKVWDIRESYLSLIVDLQAEACSMQEGIARRNDLQERYFAILGDAPRTTPKKPTRPRRMV